MYNKITISGLICTGKTTLFWGLQENLIWPTFSASQFFRDYARNHQLELDQAEEQSKKLTQKVDFRMQEMLRDSGHLICEGWMAGIMADEFPKVMRILLTCDEKNRIKRYAIRENFTEKEAVKRIKERETNLFKILEKIYKRRDFIDPRNYNLVLDTSNISRDKLIKTVLEKVVS